jgi:beta-N-acetylhexosaminidase
MPRTRLVFFCGLVYEQRRFFMSHQLSNCSLREKIGQMLLAGFRGFEVRAGDGIARDLSERHLGGVILFDQEMAPPQGGARNIRSPEQVRELVQSLRRLSSFPLWVAIDQEGGRVNRLKPQYGFPPTLSHEELGAMGDTAKTFEHACQIAGTLASLGINLNLAPVVDVDANPDNPIIKGKGRSFSADPLWVAAHAAQFVRAHRQRGILTCLKHFPGHGSAHGDTHLGLVDVSASWSEAELVPFQKLISSGDCDLVMSAHIFNSHLDPQLPATLSRAVLNGLLREKLGWRGVVVSDDLEMRAITSRYGLETAVCRAIEAGVDLLCFGNNLHYDPNIVGKVVLLIENGVKDGRISENRINESFERIGRLKNTLPVP